MKKCSTDPLTQRSVVSAAAAPSATALRVVCVVKTHSRVIVFHSLFGQSSSLCRHKGGRALEVAGFLSARCSAQRSRWECFTSTAPQHLGQLGASAQNEATLPFVLPFR